MSKIQNAKQELYQTQSSTSSSSGKSQNTPEKQTFQNFLKSKQKYGHFQQSTFSKNNDEKSLLRKARSLGHAFDLDFSDNKINDQNKKLIGKNNLEQKQSTGQNQKNEKDNMKNIKETQIEFPQKQRSKRKLPLNQTIESLKKTKQNKKNSKTQNIESIKNSYYIGDLLSNLQNMQKSDEKLVYYNHFSKSFRTLQQLSRLNLLKEKHINFKEINRSHRHYQRNYPKLILNLDESFYKIKSASTNLVKFPIYLKCNRTQKIEKYEFKMRPYLKKFLEQVSRKYEIIVYSEKSQQLMKQILIYIDPKKSWISKIISVENTFTFMDSENNFMDLSNYNIDHKKSLIISSDIKNYGARPKNGIPLIPYVETDADNELQGLQHYLTKLSHQQRLDIKNDEHFRQSKYQYFFNKNMPVTLIAKSLFS